MKNCHCLFHLILCCSLLSKICIAQDHIPSLPINTTAVFQGLTDTDTVSGNPSRWNLATCNSPGANVASYRSTRLGRNLVLSIAEGEHPYIEPVQSLTEFLKDSFAISYDFLLGSDMATQCLHFSLPGRSSTCDDIRFCITKNEKLGFVLEYDKAHPASKINFTRLPGFRFNAWHHFTVTFASHTFYCHLDGVQIFSAHQDVAPVLFTLHGWKSVTRKNITLSTGMVRNMFGNLANHTVSTTLITFETGSAQLKPECAPVINALTEALQQNTRLNIIICGHTDNVGTPSANLTLSNLRATEIKKELINRGIKESRLKTVGYGDTQPIQTNATNEGKAANRRVEFRKI